MSRQSSAMKDGNVGNCRVCVAASSPRKLPYELSNCLLSVWRALARCEGKHWCSAGLAACLLGLWPLLAALGVAMRRGSGFVCSLLVHLFSWTKVIFHSFCLNSHGDLIWLTWTVMRDAATLQSNMEKIVLY